MKRAMQLCSLVLITLLALAGPARADNADVWVGRSAPDFHRLDQFGNAHDLRDFRGQWLVLYFYPKDRTPGCTQEAEGFRDLYPLFKSHHIQVLGISVNSQGSHAEFAHALQLPFPILADPHGDTAHEYGVLHHLILTSYAARQTFLIDPTGKIRRHYTDVDPATHPGQVLRDAVSLQKNP